MALSWLGTPVVASVQTSHTVFAHNSGGSTSAAVDIEVEFGPIYVGVPASLAADAKWALQSSFEAGTSEYQMLLRTYDDSTSATNALAAYRMDVVLTDALSGFLGWQILGHQVQAVCVSHLFQKHS